ncbi:unnamed protein product [Peronospora farinosa]|uniref:FHA domain-containing protein n=1 Tax=Peronospora farinosa TaxID=134698 RepID=A0AAV0TUL9_9STRA|nr:unnamed protein product [Peronospora farinosa]CAI5725375.1 unnamed protein product [Peronospora farinosa]
MAQYLPPEWSTKGRNVFGIYLEIIKGGIVIEQFQLSRSNGYSYIVVGRMENVCDLHLAHPSVSRIHAALQFDEKGALFLYDIHSTHGCYVNKKRVVAEEYVQLHTGDVLVFGESTRLYAVCGPPELLPAEYESLNLVKFREKLDKKREIQDQKKQQEDRGASWGFREDAEEEEGESEEEEDGAKCKEKLPDYLRNLKEDDQPYKSSVSQSQINEKDHRLYQQLQTRIRKMENIKLETSRILAKQNQLEGLSEGQQNTLVRNEQRIDTLMKEIDDLEGRIHAKNDQRTKTGGVSSSSARKKRNINDELYGYGSDEDDFYDRTKANQQKIAARKQKITGSTAASGVHATTKIARAPKSEILTADSIQANVNELEAELAKLHDELTAASITASDAHAAREESKQEEQVDPLDSFMAVATTQLYVNEVDMLTKRKNEVEMELKRQRQLLTVVTPALAAFPIQKASAETVNDSVECSEVHTKSPNPVSARTAVSVTAVTKHHASVQEQESGLPEMKSVPSDKQKTRSAASQESQKVAEKTDSDTVAPKRRRIASPAMGPPPQMKPSGSSEPYGNDSSILEGGDHVWVPPINQSGDGRTKLNDKYGY